MKEMTRAKLFNQVPVGGTTHRHWANQKSTILDAAARCIEAHGANPWVFGGDARTFWQFAEAADKVALLTLSGQEHTALLGPWEEEDWDPESFGYAP